jgi:DNA-binding CsgD family transcriptional regulator
VVGAGEERSRRGLGRREREQAPVVSCAVWSARPDLVETLASIRLGVHWLHLGETHDTADVFAGPSCCKWLILDGRGEPDGAAGVLERVRTLEYWGPALVILGENGLGAAARLFRLDARLLVGDPLEEDIRLFLARSARDGREHAWVQRATSLWRFTVREREILLLSLSGVPRALLPGMLEVSDNTVKTHVRSLLRKSRTSSIPELVGCLFGTDVSGLDPSSG